MKLICLIYNNLTQFIFNETSKIKYLNILIIIINFKLKTEIPFITTVSVTV